MIGKSNRPESEISRRIEAVKTSGETSFRGLLLAGGFDLERDLRFQNLSGLSFEGEDLRGIDFTGANLVGCDFSGSQVRDAIFDRARMANFLIGPHTFADLQRAADWDTYVRGFLIDRLARRIDRHKNGVAQMMPGDEIDTHLPIGAAFQDVPTLPILIVLPIAGRSSVSGERKRVAISQRPVSEGDELKSEFSLKLKKNPKKYDLKKYSDAASRQARRDCRLISHRDCQSLLSLCGCGIDESGGISLVSGADPARPIIAATEISFSTDESGGVELTDFPNAAGSVYALEPYWLLRFML